MCKETINLGVLAHVDAGKTSVTEQLLYSSGSIRQAGSVDNGTSHTDWMAVERRRGISVRTAAASLQYRDVTINLIDTPGHVDFIGEVERCLGVLDGAVLVISSAEGVQSQTRLLWKALEQLHIPTLILINKVDRLGCRIPEVLRQIRQELSGRLFVTQSVASPGCDDCRIDTAENYWEDALEAAAEFDETMELAYLEETAVDKDKLVQTLRRGTADRSLFPVLFSSAKQGKGIQELLDGIIRYLPPAARRDDLPVSGVVYKMEHDPAMGKAAHIRLFSGHIQNRDSITVQGEEQSEKITQIRQFSGTKTIDTGEIRSGEIGAVYGLCNIKTGDIIGETPIHRSCRLAVPLLKVQVFAASEEELPELVAALQGLSEEDPLLDLEWIRESRELHLCITGMIQLEILAELIAERYRLTCSFSPPTVIYKETPAGTAEGLEVYTMPKPCWAVVRLLVEPLPRGSGIRYESVIKEKQLPYRYQNHVEASLYGSLKQGPLGWEVTDAKFTLIGGEHHHVHTHPLDFFVATPVAVLQALTNSGTTLLEPMVKVTVSAGEEYLGGVIRDVLNMRGTFDTPVMQHGQFTLEAILPVATSLEYPIAFRSMTSGKGTYASEFYGYQECPLELGKTAPRRGINPLDRSKWILYARNAMM